MNRLLIVALIFSGTIPTVWAAQLDAKIFVEDDTMSPSFSFLRIIYIEYPDGGEIAQLLQKENQTFTFTADSGTPGMTELIDKLNENLKSLSSTAYVTDAKVNYQANLRGNQNSAVMEVKLTLVPTLSNLVINQQGDSRTH